MVNIRKRGKVYQYQFEIAPVNGTRKYINKSGFKTRKEAKEAGAIEYNAYMNGIPGKESQMSYSDYLDYWLKNYCEVYLKHSTIEEYSIIVNKYLKPGLGKYRLNLITSFQLNKYLIEACMKYDYSYGYLRNFSKVIKSSFRDACHIFGFINYNPAVTLKNEFDKVEQQMLKNSTRILNRKIQLIEQGMGRGVRSSADYCVIVLMGKGVITTLLAENYISTMNQATQEQIKLSQNLGEQLKGKSTKQIFESANVCLERNEEWKSVSKEILVNASYSENIIDFSVDRVLNETFKMAKNDYEKAVKYLEQYIKDNSDLDKDIQGWLKFQLAEYYNFIDKAKSQEILKSANSLNSRILKPIEGIQYQKNQKKVNEQAQNVYDYFNTNGIDNNSFILKLKGLLEDLAFSQEIDSNQFEEALCIVGKIIGIESVRPEADGTGDPDNLWWISNTEALVIECKNRVLLKNNICKSDCEQLNHSLEWFEQTYPKITVIGLLVHPSNIFDKGCVPKLCVKIITMDKLENLKNNVQSFAEQLLHNRNYLDKDKIKELLILNNLRQEEIVNKYTSEYRVL